MSLCPSVHTGSLTYGSVHHKRPLSLSLINWHTYSKLCIVCGLFYVHKPFLAVLSVWIIQHYTGLLSNEGVFYPIYPDFYE